MVKRTLIRMAGSPNSTHRCWSSPDIKSCRFSTPAPSKSWRVCSRSVTRRQSSSWAGERSMVTSQRLLEKTSRWDHVLACNSTHNHTLSFLERLYLWWLYVWFILQLEDLGKVEGMTEKRFSSFMKVSHIFWNICTFVAMLAEWVTTRLTFVVFIKISQTISHEISLRQMFSTVSLEILWLLI